MVSQRGVEANPDKVRAIIEMALLKKVKEVQSLNGRVAALNRFVSRATGKCLPFFKVLRKAFEWTNKCQKAFEELKTYLASPSLLSPSKPGEELFLYLAVSQTAVSLVLIPREENEQADRLAKATSAEYTNTTNEVLSFVQYAPAIDKLEVQTKGAVFTFRNDWDVLYKRGFSRQYLRCLIPDEADYIMREVHKLIWVGYYWPTMQKDAQSYIRDCDKCQRFSNIIQQPTEELTPISTLWPLAQWGLDIIGPFPITVRQLKFLIVGIDYFTKWVEAEPLATITKRNVRSFDRKNIICRFGIPRVLVSDNGKQFDNDAFMEFFQ
ncbi:uncharacterized protein LOC142612284 [Castanea sativa]|uniref:uncharacterized protein LOC142612284 n=1 Tax=Castanea sativa TaxID=21020 RepID=UPI003F652383